jgi:hypothetical protein
MARYLIQVCRDFVSGLTTVVVPCLPWLLLIAAVFWLCERWPVPGALTCIAIMVTMLLVGVGRAKRGAK